MPQSIPDVSLQDNTEERTPLVLVLDCSGSMEGERITALNAGLKTLESELRGDPTTSTRGRVLVIKYGGDDSVEVSNWSDAIDFEAPVLKANGRTPTGTAVLKALAAIQAQKDELKNNGIAYKRPVLMIMSDGEATDDWQSAATECLNAEKDNKVTVFAIGVGEDAKLDELGSFSRKGAVRLEGLRFKELFVWLSASVKAVSQVATGNTAQLPATDTWASTGPN